MFYSMGFIELDIRHIHNAFLFVYCRQSNNELRGMGLNMEQAWTV